METLATIFINTQKNKQNFKNNLKSVFFFKITQPPGPGAAQKTNGPLGRRAGQTLSGPPHRWAGHKLPNRPTVGRSTIGILKLLSLSFLHYL